MWPQATPYPISGSGWTDISDATDDTYTIAATTADMSGDQYRCVVTGTGGSVTSNPAALTVSVVPTYTITVQKNGNGTATADKGTAKQGETVTLTATPDSGYRFTGWTSSNGGIFADASNAQTTFTMPAKDVTVIASFTQISSGSTGGTTGDVTPTKTPSEQATEKIEAAQPGDTVTANLTTGNTELDKEVFEELAGRDVTLEVSLPGGVSWTVNGQDIPENTTLTDLDMGVSMNTSTIPMDLINIVMGEKGTVQMTLAHNGEFGFTMTLTTPVGVENKGLWANLYHYDTTRKQMLFETAAKVDEDGDVALQFTHASEYAIVLDEKSHELPFDDVNGGDWFQAAVEYVYRQGIMNGTSATTFEPNATLSRAMVAQILYNLEDQPALTGESNFIDASGHWAANAIAWAKQTGVVAGYEGNTFQPDKAVTREELAQMLYNYATYKKLNLPALGDLSKFSDGSKVSPWAQTAMSWATGLQVINGYEDSTLRPSGNTTRAEAASMILGLATTLTK